MFAGEMTGAADIWLCDCGALPLLHVLWDAETMTAGLVCAEHMRELTSEGGPRRFAAYHVAGPECGLDVGCWQRYLEGQVERQQRAGAF